jgi:hypothetical protein
LPITELVLKASVLGYTLRIEPTERFLADGNDIKLAVFKPEDGRIRAVTMLVDNDNLVRVESGISKNTAMRLFMTPPPD